MCSSLSEYLENCTRVTRMRYCSNSDQRYVRGCGNHGPKATPIFTDQELKASSYFPHRIGNDFSLFTASKQIICACGGAMFTAKNKMLPFYRNCSVAYVASLMNERLTSWKCPYRLLKLMIVLCTHCPRHTHCWWQPWYIQLNVSHAASSVTCCVECHTLRAANWMVSGNTPISISLRVGACGERSQVYHLRLPFGCLDTLPAPPLICSWRFWAVDCWGWGFLFGQKSVNYVSMSGRAWSVH